MPVFDQLQRASFDGLEFPVKSVHVRMNGRKHVHEYLRVSGGVIEKLRRGLYEIEMDALFHATIKGYGELWPTVMAAMRNKAEDQITSTLVIPTIGSVRAMIDGWEQTAEMGSIRSGERAPLRFIEDQQQTFLTEALAQVENTSVANAVVNLEEVRANIELTETSGDLLSSIVELANTCLAFKDQTDLYGAVLSAKVLQLASLLREADRQITELQNPENCELVYALQELLDASITLEANLAESFRNPLQFTVPKLMTVSDIAVAIYKSTARANEIMINNNLPNPFAVPAGERIIYFPS